MYRRFMHGGHLGLAVGNVCFLVQICAQFVIFETTSDFATIQIGFSVVNICLVIGFWCVLLAILLAQFDQLPFFSHLISLIVGALVVLFVLPSEVRLELNPTRSSYSPAISLLETILVVVFLIFAYVPLVKKMRRTKELLREKHYLILLLGYTLITAWALLLSLSSFEWIPLFRRYLLPTGLLFWNIALLSDPLTITITQTRVQKLIVLTKTGLPVFSYDLENKRTLDMDLIAGLLSAIKSSIEEVLTSGSPLTSINFENSNLNFITGQKTLLLILGRQALSSNFRLIANHFLRKFERQYDEELGEAGLNLKRFGDMQSLILSITDKVLF